MIQHSLVPHLLSQLPGDFVYKEGDSFFIACKQRFYFDHTLPVITVESALPRLCSCAPKHPVHHGIHRRGVEGQAVYPERDTR